jgi:hypothetical protein
MEDKESFQKHLSLLKEKKLKALESRRKTINRKRKRNHHTESPLSKQSIKRVKIS